MQYKNNELPSNGVASNTNTSKRAMKDSQLMSLFEDELKDILWAEKALFKAIPNMIKRATSVELIEALSTHLGETEAQIGRLAKVFELIDKKLAANKCAAMDGLITESERIVNECEEGSMRDAGIIMAAQKIEHYEIATYGTLRQFAETLGLKEAEKLLSTTLMEEKNADELLSAVATKAINVEASENAA
jgi:ferritin-like metal-binding protein YciE